MAMAQDYNAAVDTFNNGVQAESKIERLEMVRSALTQFQACEEAEAAEMIAKCKEIIPSILVSLGKENINEKNYDDAIAYLKEAIAVAKEYGIEGIDEDALDLIHNALMRKGTTLIKANDFAGAIAAIKEASELQPEDGKTWLLLGQAFIKNAQDEDAIAALLKAAEFGQEAKANTILMKEYIKLGDAKKKERKNAEAIAYYEKALAVEENPQVVLKIANTYVQTGANAKAISCFKRYLELNPEAENANDILYTIAATAQKAGDKATAVEYYTKLKADPKYGATANQMLNQLK